MLNFMTGYRTWTGIIITFLGTIGIFEQLGLTEGEVSQIIDVVMQLVGLILAAYGNYQAHKRSNI